MKLVEHLKLAKEIREFLGFEGVVADLSLCGHLRNAIEHMEDCPRKNKAMEYDQKFTRSISERMR